MRRGHADDPITRQEGDFDFKEPGDIALFGGQEIHVEASSRICSEFNGAGVALAPVGLVCDEEEVFSTRLFVHKSRRCR